MKDIVTEKKSKTTDLEVGSAVKEPIPHDRQKGWVAQFSLKSAQSNQPTFEYQIFQENNKPTFYLVKENKPFKCQKVMKTE